MVVGLNVLMAMLLAAGGVAAEGAAIDGVPLNEANETESVDERPLYYGSEVVVVADRPERFEPFTPEPRSMEGSASDEVAWTPHVTTGGYGASVYPSVRGLTAEHVAFEYDGVPMNSVQNGLADLALFDVFDLQATVMRGPFARLASGRPAQAAFSLRPAEARGVSFSLSTGSRQDAAKLSFRRGDAAFRLGFLSDDGYAEKTSVGGFGAEASGRTPWGEAALTYIQMDRAVPGPDYAPSLAGDLEDRLLLARTGFRQAGLVRPAAYFVRHEQRYKDDYSDPTHVTTSGGVIVEADLTDLVPGTLVSGSFDYSEVDSHDTMNPDLGLRSRGSGSVVASHVLERGALNVAVEGAAMHTSDFGAALSGAVGVAATGRLGRVWVSVGRTHRPPTINELYWPEDVWTGGNEDLDPERINTFEVGLAGRLGIVSGSLSSYRSNAEDLIIWAVSGSDGLYRPMNVGDAKLTGGELEVAVDAGAVRFSYAGSFARSDDANLGKALPYRPEMSQWFTAAVTIERVTGEVRLRQVGEVYTDTTEEGELDGYSVLDVSATVDLPMPGVAVRFDAMNLLDERYQTRVGYDMPGQEWRLSLLLGWEDDA